MYVSCRNRKSGLYLLIRTITCLNFFEKLLIFKIHSFWRLKRDAGRSIGLVAVVESELEVRERDRRGVSYAVKIAHCGGSIENKQEGSARTLASSPCRKGCA